MVAHFAYLAFPNSFLAIQLEEESFPDSFSKNDGSIVGLILIVFTFEVSRTLPVF